MRTCSNASPGALLEGRRTRMMVGLQGTLPTVDIDTLAWKKSKDERRGRVRGRTARYPRTYQCQKIRRAADRAVAFFSMIHVFVSSLKGAEAAQERGTWAQLRLSLIPPSYVDVARYWCYITTGCWTPAVRHRRYYQHLDHGPGSLSVKSSSFA